MVIALFNKRFGTPTNHFGSGTEEEIEIACNAGKQVFLFFVEDIHNSENDNPEQKSLLDAFKERIRPRCIYTVVHSEMELVMHFLIQLMQYFSKKTIHSVLWVDDCPDNNKGKRKNLQRMSILFTLAESTDEAIEKLSSMDYDLVISDMNRPGDTEAGLTLLKKLRTCNIQTPYIIHTGSSHNKRSYNEQVLQEGGNGCTNQIDELYNLVANLLGIT